MQESLLVFGGGQLQLSIINRAKLLGYRTIVIDPEANAPGKMIADLFFQVPGNDFERTKQIALDYNVVGIVTAATDKPILMMCRVAEALDLPFPSYKSCETVLDKAKFKQFLKENGFLHAVGVELNRDIIPASLDFNYPVIVKPVTNSGSRGVLRCNSYGELKIAIGETLKYCKDGRYLIEEYLQGDEISVEAIVQNHKVHLFQITDKIVSEPPYNVELGHLQPSKYGYLKSALENLLQSIIEKLELNDCALHPELKINGDKITIIEIGPRLGGDFITSDLVPLSTGVNIEEQVLRIAVGVPVRYNIVSKASMVFYFNFQNGLKVIKLISEKELKEKFPEIVSFHFDLNVDDETRKITHSLNRYGQIVISGMNLNCLRKRKIEIMKYIEQRIFS